MSKELFSSTVGNAFTLLEQRLNGASNGPLHALRRTGLESFNKHGVPTTRHEEWKYTNVLPLLGVEYRTGGADQIQRDDLDFTSHESIQRLRDAMDASSLAITLVDGGLVPALSDDLQSVKGLSISALTDEMVANNADIQTALASAAPVEAHPFVALNTALSKGGVVIRVDRNVVVENPIHVIVIGDARSTSVLHTPRILVMAEEGAQVSVVESHHTIGDETAMDVSVTEILARRNSNVRHVKINDDAGDGKHIGYTGAKIWGDANVYSHVFCLGGSFTRNDLAAQLLEPNANAYLDGVSVLSDGQYADNHTVVDHMVPHCHSEELYKGVYDGQSTGVFNGKIYVRPQAQKTTAYQSNHSLLLSDRAQINAKPQLEIWADDVKCSHGATTGQLDEEAVFYLQARGIGKDEARALMTYAFAAEVVERLPLPGLKAYVERSLARKLGAESYTV